MQILLAADLSRERSDGRGSAPRRQLAPGTPSSRCTSSRRWTWTALASASRWGARGIRRDSLARSVILGCRDSALTARDCSVSSSRRSERLNRPDTRA